MEFANLAIEIRKKIIGKAKELLAQDENRDVIEPLFLKNLKRAYTPIKD